ncbi:HAD-IIB family hydrolase [Aestuariibius insulae]|uniref:HAD-IIB family hydrolase n=1 Tax=Aestuariibius insulae TaxID=2058287 RepID=UPI00345E08B3
MFVMHVALGGCFKAPPVAYGLTEDTGGHIAYVLAAAQGMIGHSDIDRVEVVTRRFQDKALGDIYSCPREPLLPGCDIVRLATKQSAYLSKEALEAELPSFTAALIDYIGDLERKPDVIHAHFSDAAEAALEARRRFGMKVLYTPHSLLLDKVDCAGPGARAGGARMAREARAIAEADAIIVSSRDEAERQVAAYGAQAEGWTHCIPPGVPARQSAAGAEDRASALISPFLNDPSRPIVLAVARPVEKKNLGALVEAFGQVEELRNRANLVILAGLRRDLKSGCAEQNGVFADLLNRIDRHDLYGSVALPKRHEMADVSALYDRARQSRGVFANPAFVEPFGLTLIEAAAAGLPVVATRNGGPSSIIETIGHGRTIDPADPVMLGRACLDLIRDTRAWNDASTAGLSNVGRYSWPAYVEKLIALVKRLPRQAAWTTQERVLLCSDIDNTLTGNAESSRLFARWSEATAVRFVIATGRSIGEARRVLDKWALPHPEVWITSVGSEIYSPDRRGRLRLSKDWCAQIGDDWDPAGIERIAASVPDLAPQPHLEQRQFKSSYFGSASAAKALNRRLTEAGLNVRVIHSHSRLIDVVPHRAGKAAALAHVARSLGLTLADCVACGDSGNDVDMLEDAGRSIIVANASSELDHLTPNQRCLRSPLAHAAGVLHGLETFGLTAPPRDLKKIAAE